MSVNSARLKRSVLCQQTTPANSLLSSSRMAHHTMQSLRRSLTWRKSGKRPLYRLDRTRLIAPYRRRQPHTWRIARNVPRELAELAPVGYRWCRGRGHMGPELHVGGFATMAAKAVLLIVFSQNGQQDSDQVVTRFLKNRHGDASGVRGAT